MPPRSDKSASAQSPDSKPKPTRTELRAQKVEREKAERIAVFGSWSGATPEELLISQCRKMNWKRPEINVKRMDRGHQATVVLSNDDMKTGKTLKISYADSRRFSQSEAEAKQFACTYALHRIASHLSLKQSLPPAHQEYWLALEKLRKTSAPDVQKYEYTEDPFSAKERRSRDDKERERLENEERERRARENDKSLRPWEAYQNIVVGAEMRKAIENLIRSDIDNPEDAVVMDAVERDAIVETLVKKGFMKLHAEEAMRYNYDINGAIEWLCIYVPEDDLPHAFHSKINHQASHGVSTQLSLSKNWALQNMSKSGFNRSMCEKAYDQTQNELDALAMLIKNLSTSDSETIAASKNDLGKDELLITRNEEVEALESIYGPEAVVKDDEHHMIRVKISNLSDAEIDAHLCVGYSDNSVYPFELPAMMLDCTSIPAYIRLCVLKGLTEEAKNWTGLPMVFEAVNWVEANLERLLNDPGISLVELKNTIDHRVTIPGPQIQKMAEKPRLAQMQNPNKIMGAKDLNILGQQLKTKYELQVNKSEYQKMHVLRERLPSFKFRDRIIESVEANQVVIICGETGCGKSTQTGQFILEHMLGGGQGGLLNIICTQPRRISAMSLAERVAAERAEKVGQTIGYSIRGENVRSKDTRLTFCTTGILLRMLQTDPLISDISHVIVDEVHERSGNSETIDTLGRVLPFILVDSDFLVVILRQLLKKRPDLRIILMSATIDSETFSNYFNGAPVLNIPGFTHPVTDVYLDEILKVTKYVPDAYRYRPLAQEGDDAVQEAPNLKVVNWVLRKESAVNPVDYSLVAATVKYICETASDHGAILVFLQGAVEIKRCIDTIENELSGYGFQLELLPLHAQLPPKDQSRVFKRPSKGVRKVVVSTNVAETSITIEDVVYVIDAGRVKEMRYENSILCLVETLTSRASCKQRRGRAGRVQPGTCFKLFSKKLENEMSPHAVPEILRVPLEQLCLTLKAMGIVNVTEFLGMAIDPPLSENISSAINLLEDLNAIDSDSGGLTALGKHMATIPADLRISKMLVFGCIFNCMSPILTIAAILSSKSPFVTTGAEKRSEAQAARATFMWDKSDLLTDARAYDIWASRIAPNSKSNKRPEYEFCDANFLSIPALTAIADLRRQYLDTLMDIGFIQRGSENIAETGGGAYNSNSTNGRIIKSVIAAGLYPHIASVQHPEVLYMETAHGTVAKEHDPKAIRFFTDGSEAFLHPSSCLCTVTFFEDSAVVFHQKVLTSKVFLRDVTMVSPWALLMFGGNLHVDHEGRTISVGNVIKFQAFPRIAVLANGLRRQLDSLLESKIESPDLDLEHVELLHILKRLF